MVAIAGMARRIGLSARQALFGALLFATLPVVVLQSATALNDLVFGGFLAVRPALSALYFGAEHAGVNYGLLFTAFGIGNVVALFAGGWIRQTTGAFLSAFYVGLALSAVGLLLGLEVRPPRVAPAPS